MRELTFPGFLSSYVRALSSDGTCGIDRLAQEAAKENPRLREPLLLYALWTGKEEYLRKSAAKVGLDIYYGNLLTDDREQVEAALRGGRMPREYQKVWDSFLSRRNRHAADAETKALIRKKVRFLQEEKHVSNYRVYTDLHLNPGNLNAWLKHGIHDKVSLDTARAVLRYLRG